MMASVNYPRSLRQITTAGLVCLIMLGCGYGTISPTAYSYAQALMSITNRQAVDQLDTIQQQIQAATTAHELSARESTWLSQIVTQAKAGHWKAANRAARGMLEDQIQR